MADVAHRLAEHHRHCEALFSAARAAAGAGAWNTLDACVEALREGLLAHFSHEEQRIFPLYEAAIGEEGATESLCAAHDDMRAALWVLASFSAAADPGRYCAELTALNAAFDAHAADEEQRMYPAFERLLMPGPARA